jgi:endonuclease YncB( thermonuclease family)
MVGVPIRLIDAQGAVSCDDFTNPAAAQAVLDANRNDPFGLDPDGNGIACDSEAATGSPAAPSVGNSTSAALPLGIPAGTQAATVDDHRDGRTLVVRIHGQPKDVVLAGVDVPSPSVAPLGECFAKQSLKGLQRIVPVGSTVYLEGGIPDRDRNRRLLRYVWLPGRNGAAATLVNRKLIRDGYATYGGTTIQGPDYVGLLQAADKKAREERRGLWKSCGGAHVKVEAPPAALGTAVRFGDFAIAATATNLQATAGAFNPQAARGIYLVVVVSITNTGDQPRVFPYENLVVRDSRNRSFTYALQATSYLQIGSGGTGPFDRLQPGLSYQLPVAFDVPTDAGGFVLTTAGNDFEIALDR